MTAPVMTLDEWDQALADPGVDHASLAARLGVAYTHVMDNLAQ